MKKINSLLLSSMIALCLTSSAVIATPGSYMNGQVGFWGAKGDGNHAFDNLFDDFEADNIAGRVGLGHLWQINESLDLGLEGGFTLYSALKNKSVEQFSYVVSKYNRHSFDILGVADLNIAPKFDIFAKAGVAVVTDKNVIQQNYQTISAKKETNTVPKVVVGAGYDLTDQVNLNLSVGHEFEKSTDYLEFSPSTTTLMLGLNYHFA